MSAYARLLYIPVLITMSAACTQRTSHVVANRLAHDRYVEPKSDAYDSTKWAERMAARDQALAENIALLKADLLALAHFEFFPPEDEWFPTRIRPRDWRAGDRAMIRQHLRDIVERTAKRRAYNDDAQLQRDATRGQRILEYFERYETRKGGRS